MTSQGELFEQGSAPGRKPWQGGMPDVSEDRAPPVHRHAHDTERAAAELVRPRAGGLRARALEEISRHLYAGLTHEELAEETGERHYSIAPRVTELVSMGWVVDSGRRRPTETGASAIVWVLSERGRAELS